MFLAKNMNLLRYLLKTYCQPGRGIDQFTVDNHGNTLLHAATMEPVSDKKRRSVTLQIV